MFGYDDEIEFAFDQQNFQRSGVNKNSIVKNS
jgi:hypothetical protein